jgi:hypothetical protein
MPSIWPIAPLHERNEHMTTKESMPSIERYRLAVVEFRAAYAQLAADDQRAMRQGFGPPPEIVQFRHAVANRGESGSLGDDIKKVL